MLPHPPLWLILLAFVCLVGPLVFFHELGHYLVARLFGIPAETFSIGFGRELVGWTDRQGTRWKVAWLPLGGYVKFVGDMSPASNPAELENVPEHLRDCAFQTRPVWQRFLVVLAGPAANFLLAMLIFAGVFSLVSAPETNKIGGIQPHSVAAAAGFKEGDRILSIAGHETRTFDDVRTLIEPRPNQLVRIEFEREGAIQQTSVKIGTEKVADTTGKKLTIGVLGVYAAPVSVVRAVPMATRLTVRLTVSVIEGAARLIIGQGSRQDVGGPIKIAQFAGQAASLGALSFVQLLALFSINLGFINLLPVPLTDGGHIFFYAIEAVRRRPVSADVLEWAFRGGLAVILALMVFVTVNDLGSVGLWDRLQRLIG
ncbi:MAG TPA: RIP metalloprotease RseP [Sphingomicrobium sp.]|jgi:regulator of sigma E protease|nr:RIP metalloprotease RseP [Sphingomicrobium sp.]